MRLRFLFLWTVAGLTLAGCVKTPPVEPTRTPLEQFVEEADTPQRGASMRLVEQGRKELAQQRFERAAAFFSRALEIDSTNPFSYFYLGLVRLQSTKIAQARDLFQRAGDLFQGVSSWKAEAYAHAGECCERLKRPDQARALFIKSREWDEKNTRAQAGIERLGP